MKAPTPGETAVDLPWLAPSAASLIALARGTAAAAWPTVRTDPGCVVLLARRAEGLWFADRSLVTSPGPDPNILESALLLLDDRQLKLLNWRDSDLRIVYDTCLHQAQLAASLAEQLRLPTPDQAWVGGLLAPLGWLAVAAVQPEAVLTCLRAPRFPQQACSLQRELWGLDHTAITRRLCRRWGLPSWLTSLIGHLGLPAGIAQTLGADPRLFQIVQLAVLLTQQNGGGLGLTIGGTIADLEASLGLVPEQVDQLTQAILKSDSSIPEAEMPAQISLLREFLRAVLDNRRQNDPSLVERLHAEVDTLQRALEEQWTGEQQRLHTMKMNALAELAAGAGHEINNPLAVISGQAQYILRQLQMADIPEGPTENNGEGSDPFLRNIRHSLQTIIQQTQRIHLILSELMQFARPPQPHRQEITIANLFGEVARNLADLSEQRRVRLVFGEPPPACQLQGDPAQVRAALTCLLRNAIEAAPTEGWAGVRILRGTDHSWHLVVEDNGPGPTPLAREHLFDPFFSGRAAGRGRGLGLPTAWRLARQHGGDVWFDGRSQGLTRFVLALPAWETPVEKPLLNGHHNGTNGCPLAISPS